jgi:hypothetical protein
MLARLGGVLSDDAGFLNRSVLPASGLCREVSGAFGNRSASSLTRRVEIARPAGFFVYTFSSQVTIRHHLLMRATRPNRSLVTRCKFSHHLVRIQRHADDSYCCQRHVGQEYQLNPKVLPAEFLQPGRVV